MHARALHGVPSLECSAVIAEAAYMRMHGHEDLRHGTPKMLIYRGVMGIGSLADMHLNPGAVQGGAQHRTVHE